MNNNNEVEVLLFSSHPLTDLYQKLILNWMITSIQAVVLAQREKVKEFAVLIWKDTPAFYMS